MNATNRRRCESPDHCDGWVDVAGAVPKSDYFRACDTCGGRHEVRFHIEPKLSWVEWVPLDMDEHVERIRAILERRWSLVPAAEVDDLKQNIPRDDPRRPFRLAIEAGLARGRTTAGTIHVSFHPVHEDQDAVWCAFEVAIKLLAAAGYEKIETGTSTVDSGYFRPIATPDG